MKIVVYKGASQYQALRVFADEIIRNLKERKAEVTVLDFERPGEEQKLLSMIGKSYDRILSMNGLQADLRVSTGEYIHDLIKAPFYAYIVDHPLYHHARLSAKLKNYHVLCVDRSFQSYIKRYYPHISTVDILMQGGLDPDCDSREMENWEVNPKRSQDIVFMGTYRDLESVTREIESSSETIQGVVCGMIEELLDDPSLTLEQSLSNVLSKAGISLSDKDFSDTMNAAHLADKYVRTYYRKLVVKYLTEQGITLHVYGENWEKLAAECTNYENLVIHPPVNYREACEVYQKAGIVLNIMPWSKNGIHDRLINAMLQGAVVVSDESTYLKSHFQCMHVKDITGDKKKENSFAVSDASKTDDQTELFLYSLTDMQALSEGILCLKKEKMWMNGVRKRAYGKVFKEDTWKKRTEELLHEQRNCF